MRRVRRKRWFALVLLVLVLILFYKSDWLGRLIYPIPYRGIIEEAAFGAGVDPLLVAAVIRVESNFRTDQVSHKGAIGIMQVMPDTANWIFERERFRNYTVEDLTNPEINIKIGTTYLGILHDQFNRDQVKSIASYNAGQGNVNKWLSNQIWDGTLSGSDSIPFWETRRYVNKVMYYYKKYQDIYSD